MRDPLRTQRATKFFLCVSYALRGIHSLISPAKVHLTPDDGMEMMGGGEFFCQENGSQS